MPQTPKDLLQHDCIRIVSLMFPKEWYFQSERGDEEIQVNGPFTVNVPEALTIAVNEGLGIGLLPAYAASEGLRDGTLRRVLPDYRLQEHTVFAIYPSRQFLDAKTKTWLEFLKQELPPGIAASEAVLSG